MPSAPRRRILIVGALAALLGVGMTAPIREYGSLGTTGGVMGQPPDPTSLPQGQRAAG